MRQMITPDEARAIVLEHTFTLPVETIAHGEALGRVLAEDIVSDIELPPFDNSAMDGYAVVAADLEGTSREAPVSLRLLETIGAGEVARQTVERGACIKIMTGAAVPEGADAVVMREETEESGGEVRFFEAARPGQSIRPRGDDVKLGETVMRAGTLVRPAQWAMLASLGKAQIAVYRAPRVGIITTGDELVEIGAELKDGQIRDSNSYSLEGLCREMGAVVARTRVGDDVDTLRAKLRECAERCDCIITSGGVSAGDFDPVRDALLAMQESGEARIHFWKIAMKPGKPVMVGGIGRWEVGDGGTALEVAASSPTPNSQFLTPIFGLPGNPVSVMVAFEQFVRPALLKMQGRSGARVTVQARVLGPFKSPEGKVEFVRACVTQDGDGWVADVTGDQSSGRLSTMTRANALLVVPADVTRVEAGDVLAAQMVGWEVGDRRWEGAAASNASFPTPTSHFPNHNQQDKDVINLYR